jgi:hypothetical protein
MDDDTLHLLALGQLAYDTLSELTISFSGPVCHFTVFSASHTLLASVYVSSTFPTLLTLTSVTS